MGRHDWRAALGRCFFGLSPEMGTRSAEPICLEWPLGSSAPSWPGINFESSRSYLSRSAELRDPFILNRVARGKPLPKFIETLASEWARLDFDCPRMRRRATVLELVLCLGPEIWIDPLTRADHLRTRIPCGRIRFESEFGIRTSPIGGFTWRKSVAQGTMRGYHGERECGCKLLI